MKGVGPGIEMRVAEQQFPEFAMYYNFVRVHKTLRVTPAMAANVTKRLWEMSDIVEVLESWEAQAA
jgi:hypothetical protein